MEVESAVATESFDSVEPTNEDVSESESYEEEVESSEEGEDGLSEDELETASKEEIREEVKRLKRLTIKYNGREYEEELPFEIEDTPEAVEYMKRQLQLAKLSQTKSQNYSQLENEVRSFIEQLRRDPKKALSNPNVGVDLKQLAAEILQEEMENAQKSPEMLEKERLERELKNLQEEREKERELLRQKEYEQTLNREYERYDIAMTKALESSDLPKSPYIVKKMADYMMLGIRNGMKIDPSDVIPVVREEMHNDLKEMFSVMPADVIDKLLGNETYDKVRKHRLSKARGGKKVTKKNPATTKGVRDVGASSSSKKESEGEKQTFKDFFGV